MSPPPGAIQQRPRDHSLPSSRTWTAAAPWMSDQFCRLQTQKNAPAAPSDDFTNSKNLGQKFAGYSGCLEKWTLPGKLL
ncbi:unnamed protein product [Caenorhabditis nigoni]